MPKRLSPTALSTTHLVQHRRSDYQITVPPDVVLDDLVSPPFWANVHAGLKKYDTVRAIREDGRLIVDLLVMNAGVGFAVMKPLAVILDETANATPVSDPREKYENKKPSKYPCIDFKRATGWRVLGYDGNEVRAKLNSEAEAQMVLDEYMAKSRAA